MDDLQRAGFLATPQVAPPGHGIASSACRRRPGRRAGVYQHPVSARGGGMLQEMGEGKKPGARSQEPEAIASFRLSATMEACARCRFLPLKRGRCRNARHLNSFALE